MKKILNYSVKSGLILITALVFIATLVFIPVSCSKEAVKENPEAVNSSQLIKISGEDANAATKTTLEGLATKWVATTDRVGIYCAQSTDGNVNIPYTASSTAFSSPFSGAMNWGAEGTTHNFYAYYPYAAGSSAATTVPIHLDAGQTQSAGDNSNHIGDFSQVGGALDFMVATPVFKTPGEESISTSVNLRYNHVFSILEFQIINATGTISEVKLSGNGSLSLTSGTIDITQTTPANAATPYSISSPVYGSEITLTLNPTAVTTTNDYSSTPKIFMMVLPKSITGYLDIAIKIGGVYKFIQREVTLASGGFDRGKKYKVQIDATTATNYPGTTLAPVLIGSTTWAPVNAGYNTTITTARPYGLMYQWGRKYGQNYDATEGTVPTILAGPIAIGAGNDPANVANFYTNNNSPWDWCTTQEASWATVYTPCPAGWRVPTNAELTALSTVGSTWVASGGPDNLAGRWFGGNHSGNHVGSIFLPAAGWRYYNTGDASSRDSWGTYWSSDVSGTNASYLDFTSTASPMNNNVRSYGFPVRCVKI